MSTVKIDKDIFVRDQYGVRVRMFVAGTEVDEVKYNEAFRLNVPVNPEDLPKTPEFVGTELLNGKVLMENKMLFTEETPEKEVPEVKEVKEEIESDKNAKPASGKGKK